MLRRLKSTSA